MSSNMDMIHDDNSIFFETEIENHDFKNWKVKLQYF